MSGYYFIEKNGTGIEKNITSIEKNGTGIEKNGTGIEKNGTGVRWGSLSALMLVFGLTFLAGSAVADVRGFVSAGSGEVRLTISDDFNLVSGTGRIDQGYTLIALSGLAACGGSAGLLAEGNGTGEPNAEGNGTGKPNAEGNGTGKPNAEGNGTGIAAEGNGTGIAAEGNGTGIAAEGNGTGIAAEGNGTGIAAEGNGTGVAAEGNGTGVAGSNCQLLFAEGNGTGIAAEGNGTGIAAEGNGTGQPSLFQGAPITAHFAEIAMNGKTASVIVYGVRANGALVELALLEVPVIFELTRPGFDDLK